jgi:hypothetical protein
MLPCPYPPAFGQEAYETSLSPVWPVRSLYYDKEVYQQVFTEILVMTA